MKDGNFDTHFRKPKFKQKSCLLTLWMYRTCRMLFIFLKNCLFFPNLSNICRIFGKVSLTNYLEIYFKPHKFCNQVVLAVFVFLSLCLTEAR